MAVHCDYFAAGLCRSCSLIETPYDVQLAEKEARCRALLPSVPEAAWLPPVGGGERRFRNRAKLVVGGGAGAVTLGIADPEGGGIDLRECLIQSREIHDAIPVVADFLNATGLQPYDVRGRRGELKFAHLTSAPSGELMVRFVVRTQEGLGRIRARVGALREALPHAAVISVNLLREHRAVLEGEQEVVLHGSSLEMRFDRVTLHLRPQSFFQTNTAVARALYAQAAEWADAVAPASLWDLYCGVGGFALHCAGVAETRSVDAARAAAGAAAHGAERGVAGVAGEPAPTRDVLGVEISEAAIDSARRSAAEAGLEARFEAGDATAFALAAGGGAVPDLVVVNPPRRGIGAELAAWLESAERTRHVIYSSCNPESLARDLAAMPSLVVREARVFDMFPHTRHLEVAVLLERV